MFGIVNYLAGFARDQAEANPGPWLATRADKMKSSWPVGIARYPLPVTRYPYTQYQFSVEWKYSHTINPLLTKHVRSRCKLAGYSWLILILTRNEKNLLNIHLDRRFGQQAKYQDWRAWPTTTTTSATTAAITTTKTTTTRITTVRTRTI